MTFPKAQSHLFIVFGASGDLAQRKLLPSLLALRAEGALGDDVAVLGVARRRWDDAQFRAFVAPLAGDGGAANSNVQAWCQSNVYFHDSKEDTAEDYRALAARIDAVEKAHRLTGCRVIYLAIPPDALPTVIRLLGQAKLNTDNTRIVVEKPFGRDLESAQQLNREIRAYFGETQIYRIDHFLGKDTVQNIAILRFANTLFETAWHRERIDNVQITVAEDIGIGRRAGYYDRAGALRDMIQNHLAQLLALIAMDAPPRFDADGVRDEKLRVLRSIDPIRAEDVVFGQYRAGKIDGQAVVGYRDEENVPDDSTTETFVAMKVSIDNWRWKGVPFYLRTGKRMPGKVTEIVIAFREPPVMLFEPLGECDVNPDILRIRLQPEEGFRLSFDVKTPGAPFRIEQRDLVFRYADAYPSLPDAYHTLILDVVAGDQTHFVRADEAEEAWRLFTPVLKNAPKPYPYEAGTWGPPQAQALVDAGATRWFTT